jgi:hypothetical protein
MNRFTDLALDKNALDFQDLFQEVLSQKVSDALDAKKVEIAATMFEDPAIAEEKIEMTRGGRATGNAIADIVAKNNARLAKKKADRAKHLRKKEKYDGGVKEEVEEIDEVAARVRTGKAHSGQPNGGNVKAIVSNHKVGEHNLKVSTSVGWDGDKISRVSHVKDGKEHPVGSSWNGHYNKEFHKSGSGITPKMAQQAIADHHAHPTVKKKMKTIDKYAYQSEEVEQIDELRPATYWNTAEKRRTQAAAFKNMKRNDDADKLNQRAERLSNTGDERARDRKYNAVQDAKKKILSPATRRSSGISTKHIFTKANGETVYDKRRTNNEEVELDEGMVDHIAKVHVHGSNVTLHMDNGKKSTQKHPSPEAALKDGKSWHKATGREAKLVVSE